MYSSRWPIYSTCKAMMGRASDMKTRFFMKRYYRVFVVRARHRLTLWSVPNVSFLIRVICLYGLFRAICQLLCQSSESVPVCGNSWFTGEQEVNVCIMNSDWRLLYGLLLIIYLPLENRLIFPTESLCLDPYWIKHVITSLICCTNCKSFQLSGEQVSGLCITTMVFYFNINLDF